MSNDIDFSQYTIEELLDAKSNIDAVSYPDNYKKLIAELEFRKEQVKEYCDTQKALQFSIAEKRVKNYWLSTNYCCYCDNRSFDIQTPV